MYIRKDKSMDHQTDSRQIAIKLGELYESCLIRDKAKALSEGVGASRLSFTR